MKRNFAKFLALALCVAMLSAALSGCGLLERFGISLPELDLSFPDKPQDETKANRIEHTLSGKTDFYAQPSWDSPVLATFYEGHTVTYTNTIIDDRGVSWALTDAGWFPLDGEKPVAVILDSYTANQEGLIFADTTVYEQPSFSAAQVTQVKAGAQVYVTTIASTGDGAWGQLEWGWIRLDDYYSMEDLWQQAGYGVVRSSDACFYASPDIYSGVVGTSSSGSRFSLLAVIDVGNLTWGYTESGWIPMDELYEEGTQGFRPCRAMVIDSTPLNVRKGPGTGHAVVTTLNYGDYVDILERVQFNGSDWGYTGEGWIYMGLTEIQ